MLTHICQVLEVFHRNSLSRQVVVFDLRQDLVRSGRSVPNHERCRHETIEVFVQSREVKILRKN